MKFISKVLFCILWMNILGQAVQTKTIVQVEEITVTMSKGTSYNIEKHRELKSDQETSTRALMATTETITDGEESIIDAIAAGIKDKQTEINLTPYVEYMVNSNDAMSLYFEALDKFPELFYTSPTNISGSYYPDDNGGIKEYTLKVEYTVDISEIDSMVQTYNTKVNDIKTNYTNLSFGELENEYIVNDYILENCTYDKSSLIPAISHTAYGALINGVAVCDGYAKAVKQLLNDCNIESGIVTNDIKDHAWNYVRIEGEYYHLDVTWNDPIVNATEDSNETNYNYFNLSDTSLRTVLKHSILPNVYPLCTSDSFDFLRNNNTDNGYYPKKVGNKLYYTDDDLGDLRSMDLSGANDTLVSSELDFYDFEGYKSKIYVDDYTTDPLTGENIDSINSYNLISKEIKTEYVTDKNISDIYKKNSQLFIENTDGSIDNISIAMKEDVNGDGVIDIEDVANVAVSYNKVKDTTGYLSLRDINGDGIIDIYDIAKISMEI